MRGQWHVFVFSPSRLEFPLFPPLSLSLSLSLVDDLSTCGPQKKTGVLFLVAKSPNYADVQFVSRRTAHWILRTSGSDWTIVGVRSCFCSDENRNKQQHATPYHWCITANTACSTRNGPNDDTNTTEHGAGKQERVAARCCDRDTQRPVHWSQQPHSIGHSLTFYGGSRRRKRPNLGRCLKKDVLACPIFILSAIFFGLRNVGRGRKARDLHSFLIPSMALCRPRETSRNGARETIGHR